MSSTSDQWLAEGNCDKCRRQKYCSKPCTASKRFAWRTATAMAGAIIAEAFEKANTEISKKN